MLNTNRHSLRNFSPEVVAKLEASMWQAYYEQNFFMLFRLLLKLFRYQFGTRGITNLRLAYYSATAAKTFRKTSDEAAALKSLEKFYKLLLSNSSESFDGALAARTELDWWIIHRYPKQGSLPEALAKNMAALYSLPTKSLSTYGKYRAQAMTLRDSAAHKSRSQPDWPSIQKDLEKSYIALSEVVTAS